MPNNRFDMRSFLLSTATFSSLSDILFIIPLSVRSEKAKTSLCVPQVSHDNIVVSYAARHSSLPGVGAIVCMFSTAPWQALPGAAAANIADFFHAKAGLPDKITDFLTRTTDLWAWGGGFWKLRGAMQDRNIVKNSMTKMEKFLAVSGRTGRQNNKKIGKIHRKKLTANIITEKSHFVFLLWLERRWKKR